jgi:nitrate reductase molybdenum cofactor assembly chaperone NarJ/NarW
VTACDKALLLDRLAEVVEYPDAAFTEHVRACVDGLAPASPTAAERVARFASAVAGKSEAELQEHYTAVLDLNPACALELGWHLFGDAHERGAFMAALREDEERVATPARRELPDHVTQILALLGREEPARAALLATLVLPAIDTVRRALEAAASPYTHLLDAIQTMVAGIAGGGREEVPAS